MFIPRPVKHMFQLITDKITDLDVCNIDIFLKRRFVISAFQPLILSSLS